ncbi:MAG: outer membrane protein [Legionellaceae bacterium]
MTSGKTSVSPWELDLGLGFILNSPGKTSSQINISSYEIDQLLQTQSATKLSYYVASRATILSTPNADGLRALTLGLSNYYTDLKSKGSVNQYQTPLLNNYTYTLQSSIDDLLLELQMKLSSFHQLTPFVAFGTGLGFGSMSYKETPKSGVIEGQNQLGTHHQTLWAFDIGAGGSYPITEKIGVTLQYLYIVHTNQLQSHVCNNVSCLLEPLETHMNLSELMVSLHYQFG